MYVNSYTVIKRFLNNENIIELALKFVLSLTIPLMLDALIITFDNHDHSKLMFNYLNIHLINVNNTHISIMILSP